MLWEAARELAPSCSSQPMKGRSSRCIPSPRGEGKTNSEVHCTLALRQSAAEVTPAAHSGSHSPFLSPRPSQLTSLTPSSDPQSSPQTNCLHQILVSEAAFRGTQMESRGEQTLRARWGVGHSEKACLHALVPASAGAGGSIAPASLLGS